MVLGRSFVPRAPGNISGRENVNISVTESTQEDGCFNAKNTMNESQRGPICIGCIGGTTGAV